MNPKSAQDEILALRTKIAGKNYHIRKLERKIADQQKIIEELTKAVCAGTRLPAKAS